MLSFLKGKLVDISEEALIVEAGNFGLEVFATPKTIEVLSARKNEEIFLYAHLDVKEDGLEIYGFKDKEELGVFKLLVSVSGIGPRAAIALLNASSATELAQAILSEDVNLLTKVSGIGTKKAERLIIELKDKFQKSYANKGLAAGDSEVIDALTSLGYSSREAREAASKLSGDIKDVETRIKEALKVINK